LEVSTFHFQSRTTNERWMLLQVKTDPILMCFDITFEDLFTDKK
jgi:hypothetical protein